MRKESVPEFRGLGRVYGEYLRWFRRKAVSSAVRKGRRELAALPVYNEDVFDGGSFTLNRMYFLVFLPPSQSRSGKPEYFSFSQLNLMERTWSMSGGDRVEKMIPLEYRLE